MNSQEFRKRGKQMIDYVADYLENITSRRPYPEIKPGYIQELLPDQAPDKPDKWEDIFTDIERVIMPGVAHWNHPQFTAYFPGGNSCPAIVADILSDALGNIGFSWASSPACTELEMTVLDWLGKMMDLPPEFLFGSGGKGGGVLQGTASEGTLIALLSARTCVVRKLIKFGKYKDEEEITPKLMAYCSDQSHSSVSKAGLIGMIKIRKIQTDNEAVMRGFNLRQAIEQDKIQGFIPFFVCATLGTTSMCAFDNIMEIGPICKEEDIWMHIDAAYAGSSFICPEFRPKLNGIESSRSASAQNDHQQGSLFNIGPCRWIHNSLRVKDSKLVSDAFDVDELILKHDHEGKVPDYRHWGIPLGRRFRSLKLWFVLRSFGKEGLRSYIRNTVKLAEEFEESVKSDTSFEVIGKVVLGLVCFRLKGGNDRNVKLLKAINDDGRLYLSPSMFRNTYFLRYTVCATKARSEDVKFSWKVIQGISRKLFSNRN